MRMRLLLLILLAGNVTAAPVPGPPAESVPPPESAPQVELRPSGEAACYEAARDRRPEPAACDVVILRAGVETSVLAATHNNRGLILAAMNQPDDALADFERALQLAPELSQAEINRANVLLQLARYPEALAAYNEALARISIDRHVALFNRGLAYCALGNIEQARDDLAAARRLAAAPPRPQPLM